jgi:hypothetical protein
MEQKPPKTKCACGRSIPQRWNSTIQEKQCPNCKLKNLTSGDTEAVKFGLSARRSTKKTTPKKKSPKTLAMDNADKWFSLYIRIKYSYSIQDGEVFCQCIVDPSIIKNAKKMDNGHCFSRENKPTRYYEDNCRPQNRSSNRYSGEADHYTFIDNLTEEIGQERFDEVDRLRRTEGEDNIYFYQEQSDKYKKLVNDLAKEHDIKKWW